MTTAETVTTPTPPSRRPTPRQWVRDNLFSTWYNSALTAVFVVIVGWALYQIVRFVFVTGRWEIIEVNLTFLLIGGYPREEIWRLWIGMYILAAVYGFAAGAISTVRRTQEAEGRARPAVRGALLRRAGPIVLATIVLLGFAGSLTGTLLVIGVAAVGLAARIGGARMPRRLVRLAGYAAGVGLVAAFVVVVSGGGVGWQRWEGLLLTVFLAVGGIVISFPIGVLLALGRRSSLPGVRVVCVVYIELIRGVPLITLLFMGFLVIPFFLPQGFPVPSLVTRAVIALVMFTAAYVAEIVRGGIQSIPRGQFEAAAALALSPFKTTRLIVLPQALRAVIPALVSQFISLYKDTSLVSILGLAGLLGVAQLIPSQGQFVAQGLIFETLIFAGFLYWIACYSMSRESQRLERRLGVGER